jgi:hypothetical protein
MSFAKPSPNALPGGSVHSSNGSKPVLTAYSMRNGVCMKQGDHVRELEYRTRAQGNRKVIRYR